MNGKVITVLTCLLVLGGYHCAAQEQDTPRVVHVYVALCDNEHQGIEPVPKALGDGEDPEHNLYWGAMYGVKTFFSRSAIWSVVATVEKPSGAVLERVVFRHATANAYIVADAYKGSEIKRAITDFLDAVSGEASETVTVRVGEAEVSFEAGGAAELVAYVGHNGLMDFDLEEGEPDEGGRREGGDQGADKAGEGADGKAVTGDANSGASEVDDAARARDTAREDGGAGADTGANGGAEAVTDAAASGDAAKRDAAASRGAVVLCCMSNSYFSKRLEKAGVRPLLTTTGLMAPEAYTLKAALDGWIANESAEQIRVRAARAYDEYQDCNLAAAKRLFGVTDRAE